MAAGFQPPVALSPDSLSVSCTVREGYLEAIVTGFKSPAGAAAVIASIGDAIRQARATRVLIDVRQVIGQMATTDHANVGEVLARHLGSVRCAVVARADRPRGEIEPAAREGGVDYKAFEDAGEAVDWLLQPTASIEIRPAVVEDVPLILRLIRELAVYEKAEQEVTATEADIRESLFGEGAHVRALVCQVDGVDAGYAVYFFNYSTWQGRKGLYLEDLYVSPVHRNAGAGKAMLKHLARVAVDNGCGRFEWSVLDWNELAIRFYRSIGAAPMDEWVRYRLAGQALADFAQAGNG